MTPPLAPTLTPAEHRTAAQHADRQALTAPTRAQSRALRQSAAAHRLAAHTARPLPAHRNQAP